MKNKPQPFHTPAKIDSVTKTVPPAAKIGGAELWALSQKAWQTNTARSQSDKSDRSR